MIQTILYASDLGAYSAYSLAYVEQLAQRFQAKILMLHVVPPIDALASAVMQSRGLADRETLGDESVAALLETIREEAYERLLADEFGLDFSRMLTDIIVKPGHPANTIVDFAHHQPVDLIVIGNCTYPSDDRPILGSVANKVLQLARVPVFLVPLNMTPVSSTAPSVQSLRL